MLYLNRRSILFRSFAVLVFPKAKYLLEEKQATSLPLESSLALVEELASEQPLHFQKKLKFLVHLYSDNNGLKLIRGTERKVELDSNFFDFNNQDRQDYCVPNIIWESFPSSTIVKSMRLYNKEDNMLFAHINLDWHCCVTSGDTLEVQPSFSIISA